MNTEDFLNKLKQGNQRFSNNLETSSKFINKNNFNPNSIIISCMDSRVPVENIFGLKIGESFVIRVAGNTINNHTLSSIEFVISKTNVNFILVLGHSDCAAIKAAIDENSYNNGDNNITNHVYPAIEKSYDFKGEKNSTNPEFVNTVCENNVLNSIDKINSSSIIKKNINNIKLVPAIYSVSDGIVSFL